MADVHDQLGTAIPHTHLSALLLLAVTASFSSIICCSFGPTFISVIMAPSSLISLLVLCVLVVISPVYVSLSVAQTAISAISANSAASGTITTASNLDVYTFSIPSTLDATWDIFLVTRRTSGSGTPLVYASLSSALSTTSFTWSSVIASGLGNALILNTHGVIAGGALPTSAAGSTLYIGVTSSVAATAYTLTLSYKQRIPIPLIASGTDIIPTTVTSDSLILDGCQIYTVTLPLLSCDLSGYSQKNCTSGAFAFNMSPQNTPAAYAGGLYLSAPPTSYNTIQQDPYPYATASYTSSSTKASLVGQNGVTEAVSEQQILLDSTGNSNNCLYAPCKWIILVWASTSPMNNYAMRVQRIDVFNNQHTILANNQPYTGTLTVAQSQWFAIQITVPQSDVLITLASTTSGGNADMFVQYNRGNSHPNINDFPAAVSSVDYFVSVLDTPTEILNIRGNVTAALYNTVTSGAQVWWVGVIAQRATAFTLTVSVSGGVPYVAPTPNTLVVSIPAQSTIPSNTRLMTFGNNYDDFVKIASYNRYMVMVPSDMTMDHDIYIVVTQTAGNAATWLAASQGTVDPGAQITANTGVNKDTSGATVVTLPGVCGMQGVAQAWNLASTSTVSVVPGQYLYFAVYGQSTTSTTGSSTNSYNTFQTSNYRITLTYALRRRYTLTQSQNYAMSWSAQSLIQDAVQMYELEIPLNSGCDWTSTGANSGIINSACAQGHVSMSMTASNTDSINRGSLLITYPTIATYDSERDIIPYDCRTFGRSSDTGPWSAQSVIANNEFCFVPPCRFRVLVWANHAPMYSYTMRYQSVDIDASNHTEVIPNAGETAKRYIADAELHFWIFDVIIPNAPFTLTLTSYTGNMDMDLLTGTSHAHVNSRNQWSGLDQFQETIYMFNQSATPVSTLPLFSNTPAAGAYGYAQNNNGVYNFVVIGQRAGYYTVQVNVPTLCATGATNCPPPLATQPAGYGGSSSTGGSANRGTSSTGGSANGGGDACVTSNSGGSGLSGGAIAGIVIGCVVGSCLLLLLLVCCVCGVGAGAVAKKNDSGKITHTSNASEASQVSSRQVELGSMGDRA